MTPEIARERVARGAALLDEKRPGWESTIDVTRLNLQWCTDCVLGQLCGNYYDFFPVDVSHQPAQFLGVMVDPVSNGFTLGKLGRDPFSAPVQADWAVLRAAWVNAIRERLAVSVDPPQVVWTPRERLEA